jgi:peroxiredoxin Q/BCP
MRLLSVLSALIVAMFVAAQLHAADLKVGDDAPDFELTASDDKTYKLSDFKGKQAVVVAWFPRAFTGGCTKECKSFKEDGKKLRSYNVAYFTASTDPVEKNKDFAKSLDLDYPILSDPKGKVATAYGIYNAERDAAMRVTFVIDRNGKIAAIDSGVKTETHGADVAAKLKELDIEEKK